jgi:hypothetical protein
MFQYFLPIFIGISFAQEECELANILFGWNISQYKSIHYIHGYNLPISVYGLTTTLSKNEIPLIILDEGDDIITQRGKLGMEMRNLELNTTTVITKDLAVDEVPKSHICASHTLPHLLTIKKLEGEDFRDNPFIMILHTCQLTWLNESKTFKLQHGLLLLTSENITDDSEICMELLKNPDVQKSPLLEFGNEGFCLCRKIDVILKRCQLFLDHEKNFLIKLLFMSFFFFGGIPILLKIINTIYKCLLMRENRGILPMQNSIDSCN